MDRKRYCFTLLRLDQHSHLHQKYTHLCEFASLRTPLPNELRSQFLHVMLAQKIILKRVVADWSETVKFCILSYFEEITTCRRYPKHAVSKSGILPDYVFPHIHTLQISEFSWLLTYDDNSHLIMASTNTLTNSLDDTTT